MKIGKLIAIEAMNEKLGCLIKKAEEYKKLCDENMAAPSVIIEARKEAVDVIKSKTYTDTEKDKRLKELLIKERKAFDATKTPLSSLLDEQIRIDLEVSSLREVIFNFEHFYRY